MHANYFIYSFVYFLIGCAGSWCGASAVVAICRLFWWQQSGMPSLRGKFGLCHCGAALVA